MEYWKNLDLADIKYFCEFDQVWKTEEWRNIINYEGSYHISDLGRIKSVFRFVKSKNNTMRTNKEMILTQAKNKRGYLQIRLIIENKQKTRTVHQLVSESFLNHTPCGHKKVINHKNFIKTDNRKLNLEITTQRENSNRKHIKHTSQYTGVGWSKVSKKWRARIIINRQDKHLGTFINEIDAHNAYQEALEKHLKKASRN